MDNIERAFFELKFENEFLKQSGNSFQELFSSIMELKYPSDFMKTKPWGKQGDKKNDGYVKSTRTLYQVYAPNEMKSSEAINKINTDFNGALPYWKEHFSNWVFVHNSREGLAPEINKKLLELGKSNEELNITHYSYPEMRNDLFSLSKQDVIHILGHAPSSESISRVGFDKIAIVLKEISQKKPVDDINVKPVPANKLQYNKLSNNVEILLKAGMRKSNLVSLFFEKWPEPEFGDQITKAFRDEYEKLNKANISPDLIFYELQKFAGGTQRGNPDHEASVLAVLAHFFEECDIFEDPDNTGVKK